MKMPIQGQTSCICQTYLGLNLLLLLAGGGRSQEQGLLFGVQLLDGGSQGLDLSHLELRLRLELGERVVVLVSLDLESALQAVQLVLVAALDVVHDALGVHLKKKIEKSY